MIYRTSIHGGLKNQQSHNWGHQIPMIVGWTMPTKNNTSMNFNTGPVIYTRSWRHISSPMCFGCFFFVSFPVCTLHGMTSWAHLSEIVIWNIVLLDLTHTHQSWTSELGWAHNRVLFWVTVIHSWRPLRWTKRQSLWKPTMWCPQTL